MVFVGEQLRSYLTRIFLYCVDIVHLNITCAGMKCLSKSVEYKKYQLIKIGCPSSPSRVISVKRYMWSIRHKQRVGRSKHWDTFWPLSCGPGEKRSCVIRRKQNAPVRSFDPWGEETPVLHKRHKACCEFRTDAISLRSTEHGTSHTRVLLSCGVCAPKPQEHHCWYFEHLFNLSANFTLDLGGVRNGLTFHYHAKIKRRKIAKGKHFNVAWCKHAKSGVIVKGT